MGMNLVVASLAALSQSPSPAPARFHAVVLEGEGYTSTFDLELAVSINEAGESVGSVVGFDGAQAAAYWNQAGELTNLGGQWQSCAGINDDGLAIGWGNLYPDTLAQVWDLDTGQTAQLPFPAVSYGADVGPNSGLLVLTYGPSGAYSTFLERDGAAHVIAGNAGRLNAHRQASGTKYAGGGTRAFRWSAATGAIELLDPPAGFLLSFGSDLNDAGTVVGYAGDGNIQSRAVLWPLSNVPALLPPVRQDAISSEAYALGSQGWVVGAEWIDETANVAPYGVLWVGGVPYKLDDLVTNSPPVHVQFANDVNGAGQIVGRAIVRGVGRAVRLDPVAGP